MIAVKSGRQSSNRACPLPEKIVQILAPRRDWMDAPAVCLVSVKGAATQNEKRRRPVTRRSWAQRPLSTRFCGRNRFVVGVEQDLNRVMPASDLCRPHPIIVLLFRERTPPGVTLAPGCAALPLHAPRLGDHPFFSLPADCYERTGPSSNNTCCSGTDCEQRACSCVGPVGRSVRSGRLVGVGGSDRDGG